MRVTRWLAWRRGRRFSILTWAAVVMRHLAVMAGCSNVSSTPLRSLQRQYQARRRPQRQPQSLVGGYAITNRMARFTAGVRE